MSTSVATGFITITRAAAYVDSLRNYAVLIDGAKAADIAEGETIQCVTTYGSHEVMIRIAWCSSPRLIVQVGPNVSPTLECKPASSFATVLYWITIGCRRYIQLHVR